MVGEIPSRTVRFLLRKRRLNPPRFDLMQTDDRVFPKLVGVIHQPSSSQVEFADKKKITRREKFLTRMEAVIPRTKLLAVLDPFYPNVADITNDGGTAARP
jgi:hypothetical protein